MYDNNNNNTNVLYLVGEISPRGPRCAQTEKDTKDISLFSVLIANYFGRKISFCVFTNSYLVHLHSKKTVH